ncbi:alpha amylase / alpha-glucosidase [Haloferax elongans ATCC BAA-1513]|uniref:Alpha amylase / alpha-glucosidase n=1 Tax=Haloferax elongans ATCC BAA-1513 TaxID=1230453 RepID=M0HSV8_HALEO|nr:alpha-amylase family glycosyl hydrolase [Haloferax elongans]ELZ87680.1 alpha amylase / alpha-glucosidase [Haloferax elongans ATCC BAA-1513]
MHHPGPPRFTTVGEPVELAPRNPDPDATFQWTLTDAPEESAATLSDDPVVHLDADVPGVYVAELDAPDGTHRVTVRVFPDPRQPARFSITAAEVEQNAEGSDDEDGTVADFDIDALESASVIGPFNDFTMGADRVERDGDEWGVDVRLPPGDHDAIFAFDDEFDPYATAEVTIEGAGRPNIRLAGRVEGDEVVVKATARPAPDGREPTVEFYFDDRDDLAESAVEIDGDRVVVDREDLPALSRVHAVAVSEEPLPGEDGETIERASIADTLEIRADGETVDFSNPADAPEWLDDATMYQIFVREFAGETVETTFTEIERRVPYIDSLGVDVVWFTPVCESPTRHGYHITDFFDTATDLGTREEFESLVDTLHEAGITVIFDLVINHTSRDHPAFQLHRAGVADYEDYYERVPAEQDASGIDWAGDDAPGMYFNWAGIPNLNYDSLDVRAWMLDVIDEWVDVVDGFRCDVAWGVPHGFWKEVRERVKAEDDDFLLLDETVPRDVQFRENEFDYHYDTDLYDTLRDIGTGDAPASALFDALVEADHHGFPDEAVHMRYVENHDETRYATECEDGTLGPAAAATFTLPGVPMIYYGQERGVPEQRGTMRWYDGDAELTDFHRRLVALRNEHPALRSKDVSKASVEVESGDADSVVAYRRAGEDESLLIVLNFDSSPATVSLGADCGTEDLLSGVDVAADAAGEVAADASVEVTDVVVLRERTQ